MKLFHKNAKPTKIFSTMEYGISSTLETIDTLATMWKLRNKLPTSKGSRMHSIGTNEIKF